ncbi:MAG: response regulator, partial [bacterium]|nr:response regulator [bacterium]
MNGNRRILVIDDEKGLRDMLKYELESRGYAIDAAANGDDGLELIRRKEFDVVIADIKMPGMNGLQLLEKIKKINPDMDVVMITGFGTMDTVIECIRKGASDYINKPFTMNELNIVLDRISKQRNLKETVALYEMGKQLFSTTDLTEVLKIIMTSVQKILRADDASLFLKDGRKLCLAVSEPREPREPRRKEAGDSPDTDWNMDIQALSRNKC